MPASARKSPAIDKKRESPRSTNPENWKKQTLPKSINCTAAKYPSPPGVEGARPDSARLTARGSPPKRDDKKLLKKAPLPVIPKPRYQRTSTAPPSCIQARPALRAPPARSARKPARGITPEACNRKDGQTAPKPKSPKVRTDELIDEVVYRPN